MYTLILQRIILEAIFDIVYWPLWWYTGGVVYAFRKSVALIAYGNEWLAPGIWLRNIFVPMFGQHDFTGRAISFFMRLVNVLVRGFALAVWSVCSLLLLLAWVIVPILIVYSIVKNV